jgi:hypothetical protein
VSLLNYSGGYPSDELRSAMALIRRPESPNWKRYLTPGEGDAPRCRVGINLAAPADHVAPDGVVWLGQGVPDPDPKRRRRQEPGPVSATMEGEALAPFSRHPVRFQAAEGAWNWVGASGVEGLRQLTIPLVPKGGEPRRYTVRLHFAEPADLAAGERVFTVALQGKPVLERFDIAKAAGGPRRAIARAFPGIEVKDTLTVTLEPAPGARPPILCGVEALAE